MKLQKKGVFVGLTTFDIIHYLDFHPGANEKKEADAQLVFAGGPAANAAVAFSRFGNLSYLISHLGTHSMALVALQDLKDNNIILKDLLETSGIPPTLSTILINTVTGDRSVIYKKQPYFSGRTDKSNDLILPDCSIFMCDGHLPQESLALAKQAKKMHVPVVADFGSWKDGLMGLLPVIDVAICSQDFLPLHCSDNMAALRFLCEKGVKKVAYSRGEQPIVAFEDGAFREIAVRKVKAIDTLGAGDILHGCFCHYYPEEPFLISLEKAALHASESVRHQGTRTW